MVREDMTAADDISVRATGTGPAELLAYAGLLSEVFGPGEKFSEAALAWRYRDNPAGQVVGADAWAGNVLAAHYVTCPCDLDLAGAPARGLLSLNTATHPDFQGRGLFVKLAEAAYARGADDGFDCVIGVANANSTPGFIRRLGFQLVSPLDAGVLLRAPRRRPPADMALEGRWSPDALAWRLSNPAGRYRLGRSGELGAVWSPTHLPLVHCAAYLPSATTREGAPLGGQLYIGLDPRLRAGGLVMAPLPQRLRPSPLNLIYRPLSSRAPAVLDPGAVAISFLDFDPY